MGRREGSEQTALSSRGGTPRFSLHVREREMGAHRALPGCLDSDFSTGFLAGLFSHTKHRHKTE